jgi:hypothetical protein
LARTLVATVLYTSKGKKIYCRSNQINDHQLSVMKRQNNADLEDKGFTFIDLFSADYANIKGYAVFYEGHANELSKLLGSLSYDKTDY